MIETRYKLGCDIYMIIRVSVYYLTLNLSRFHVELHLLSVHDDLVPQNHLVEHVVSSAVLSGEVEVQSLHQNYSILTSMNIDINI